MRRSNDTWEGKTRGGLFGYRFFLLLIRLLGIRAAYLFLGLVVVYFIPFAPKATRATWRYARHILRYNPVRSFFFLFLSYYRFGQTLIDKVAIGSGLTDGYSFDFDDTLPDFLRVLDSRRGAILISAHIGNWEIGAPFFREYGKKMNIVLFDAEYEKIKQLLAGSMKEVGYKLIPVNDDGLAHVFAINNALSNKEYVCMQGDRFTEGSKTIRARFMGQEAGFPAGPFVLASRMKVPVVFYFAVRERDMKYKFIFIPVGPDSAEHLLEQYVSALESLLAGYPSQWFNYYDFWK